jgi:hypothetical protein
MVSDRIEDQIEHMVNVIDSELPPITVGELNTMLEPSVAIAPTRRSLGSIVAVTVATVVLVVVAGVALLINNPGDTPPADKVLTTTAESTPTTLHEQAPTTVTPDTTIASNTTVAPPTTSDPEIVSPAVGVVAETLAMLDVALEQDEVIASLGWDNRAALEYVYSYLAGAAESQNWPEPAFDTSPLGAEILLTAVDLSASFSELDFLSEEDFLGPPSINSGGLPMAPFFAGAQLEGTTSSAAFTIVLAFKDDIVDVQWRLSSESQMSQTTDFLFEEFDVPNIIMGQAVNDGPVVFGGLPPDASVITTTFEDGTRVWQRPVSGIAIFDDPNSNCVLMGGSANGECGGGYTVLNANGDEILQIVFGAGVGFEPFGFRVDSP